MAGGSNTGFTISAALVDNISAQSAAISKTLQALKKSAEDAGRGSKTVFDSTAITRAAEGMKTFGDQSLGAARAIERMVPGMQLLTAAGSIAAIAAMGKNWADTGVTIGRTANLLQMPVQKLSTLQIAARENASSSDAMTASLQGLNDVLSAAHWHRPDAPIALLNALQIGFDGVAGKARTAEDALGDVAEAVTARNNDPDAQKRLLEQLHIDPSLIALLRNGRKGLQDALSQADKSGPMTDQMAKDATELSNVWQRLAVNLENSNARILDSWSKTVAGVMRRTAELMEDHQKALDKLQEVGLLASLYGGVRAMGAGLSRWGMPWLSRGLSFGEGIAATALPLLFTGPAGGEDPEFSERKNQEFLHNQGYRPGVGPRASGGSGGVSLDNQTVTRARAVHDGLMAADIPGMNDNLAWGFAGNSVQESNADPSGPNGDGGAAHGLMKWRDSRLDDFVSQYHHRPEQGTLAEAIAFMKWELTHTEAEHWRQIQALGSGSPGEAGAAISDLYERPNPEQRTAEEQRRWELSQRLAGTAAPPPDTPPAANNGAVHVTVDVRHNGTQAAATSSASGIATTAPPRVESPMNVGAW